MIALNSSDLEKEHFMTGGVLLLDSVSVLSDDRTARPTILESLFPLEFIRLR